MTNILNPRTTDKVGYSVTLNSYTEEQIKSKLISIKPAVIDALLRLIISPCGRESVDTAPIYYLHELLIGVEKNKSPSIVDFFNESGVSQIGAFISIALLNYVKDPSKETFGDKNDILALQELLDFLTAWENLIRAKNYNPIKL